MPFMNIILVKTPSHRSPLRHFNKESTNYFPQILQKALLLFYASEHLPIYRSTLVPEEARRHLVPWNRSYRHLSTVNHHIQVLWKTSQ